MERELPDNWIATNLENLFKLIYGKGLPTKELLEEGYDVYGANGIIGKYDKYLYEKSKVIISCRGAASGAIHRTNEKSFITSNSIILDEFTDTLIDLGYVKYAMTNLDKSDVITGTAQPQITVQLLKNLQFPVAPLPEQKRIVAKLDALFGHLDTLKTKLDRIPELLKNFRQQVLTQAVTGKLTEVWREGKGLEEWNFERAESVCGFITKGTTPKSGDMQNKGEVPFLKVYNIVDQKIDFEYKPQFISNDIHENDLKRSVVYPGTVIMNIVGPPLGKVAIIPNDYEEWNINQALAIFRPSSRLKSEFLYFILREGTPITKISQEYKGVVGQSNISLTQCRNFSFPIPSIEEQLEIVRRVEELFALADSIESQDHSLKFKIDNLPQAILNKAFKGELVPQDENDEPAGELLKRIKALQEEAAPKPKKAKNYKLKKSDLSVAAEEGEGYGE